MGRQAGKGTNMWVKAGSRYFNTDTIAYVQVTLGEHETTPKTVYLHFVNESHTFTLHGDEAVSMFQSIENSCIVGTGKAAVSMEAR